MPVKIRLKREGRKKKPFYHIVVADSRAPRDGRFIEKIGYYNPETNPATIELNFDKALDWLLKGAQPTDTCRAILSYRGVLYKKHLITGVRKGAFSEEEAEVRFEAWMKEKEEKIQAKREQLQNDRKAATEKRLEAEAKINEIRAQELAKKHSKLLEETAKAREGDTATQAKPEETAEKDEPQAADVIVEQVESEASKVPKTAAGQPETQTPEASTEETPETATEPAKDQPAEETSSPENKDEEKAKE